MAWWMILLCALMGLALCLSGVFLLRRWFSRLVDRRIERYQNDLMARQIEEVENLYRQIRGWRHDLHNHVQTMRAFLVLGQTDKLEAYLNELGGDLGQVDQVLKTGNVMADAVLNSKLSLAQSRGLSIHAKATVPAKTRVSDVRLCAILGNLLDNAMEACLRIDDPEQRFIRLYIGTLKQQLYISVTNSAGRELRKEGGRFLSEKSGRDNGARYGFGLMRIDRIARQCGGYVNRRQEEGVFATEVMLPL